MKRVWLSSPQSPLGKAAAKGLKALGWQVDAEPDAADARVLVLQDSGNSCVMPEGASPLIILAPASDRLGLTALSLSAQRLAVAAAPATRVNAVAVEQGKEDQLGATVDWLAGAGMVTGQLILLSSAPGPSIPM